MTPQEQSVEIQNELNAATRNLVAAQSSITGSTTRSDAANQKFAQSAMVVVNQLGKLYNAQLQYEIAISKGASGAAAFNNSIDAMTEAAQVAAVALSLLVPGGPVIKGVVAGLTLLGVTALRTQAELQKAANEQFDSLNKTYQGMSRAGVTASDGMQGLFEDAQKLNLSVTKLDGLASVLANNAQEMSNFGGTAYKGRKELANLVGGMGDFSTSMLNMGMNYDEQAEAALGFMRIQSTLSLGQQRDYGKLASAARQYIVETEAITKLTGLSRKQQEDAKEKTMSDQRSGAAIAELMDQGKTKAAELLLQQAAIYKKMGPVAEQGYNDIISGNVNTDAARKLNQSTNYKVMQDQRDIMEGRITTEQEAMAATQETAGVMKQVRKDMGSLYKAGVGEDFLLPFKEMGSAAKIFAGNLSTSYGEAKTEVDKLATVIEPFTNLLDKQTKKMLAQQEAYNKRGFTDETFGMESILSGVLDGFKKLLDDAGNLLIRWAKNLLGITDRSQEAKNKVRDRELQAQIPYSKSQAVRSNQPGYNEDSFREEKTELDAALADAKKRYESSDSSELQQAQAAMDKQIIETRLRWWEQEKARALAIDETNNEILNLDTLKLMRKQRVETLEKRQADNQAEASKQSDNKDGKPSVDQGKLLAYIAKLESSNQNDRLTGGGNYPEMTSKTVKEVLDWQKGLQGNTAFGSYQIKKDTLQGLVKSGDVKENDVFDQSTQDKAATALLKQAGLDEFLNGKIDKNTFADKLTKIWAALPGPDGKSAYEGVGDNKAGDTRENFLDKISMNDGAQTGYSSTDMASALPTKDGAVPVTMMNQEFNMTAASLGELVEQLKTQRETQDYMVTVLEGMLRAQNTTADNTGRMAAFASN